MQMRKGERAARDLANVRSERYFERDHYWYYTTREGVDIGPYDSKSEAVNGCCLYINYLNTTFKVIDSIHQATYIIQKRSK